MSETMRSYLFSETCRVPGKYGKVSDSPIHSPELSPTLPNSPSWKLVLLLSNTQDVR